MASNDADTKFLLSCLMNGGTGKINFEAVAKENGYTNPRSASNKLAAMKKSAGISATSSSNDKPAASTAAVRDGKVTKRTLRKNNKALSKKVEGATESTKDS